MAGRVTITDIAKAAAVSLHTVNKALHGKPGVAEATRSRVLAAAKAMDFRINRVAQCMARKPLLVGGMVDTPWLEVRDAFRKGIDRALAKLRDYNVEGRHYQGPVAAALGRVVEDEVDVLICNHASLDAAQAAFLGGHGIPFAFLGSDMLEGQRLACVRSDGAMAGRLAAELLAMRLGPGAGVVAMTGWLASRDHYDKVASFLAALPQFGLKSLGVHEHLDRPELAAALADEVVAANPEVKGVYAATANSPALCRRLVELGLGGKVAVVATDLYGDIKKYLLDGVVCASLFQDCALEGERLVEALYAHLSAGVDVSSPILVPPAVVLRGNLELFLN